MTGKNIVIKLSPDLLQKIGVIGVLAGNIEFWLERTIWALKNERVEGLKPSTDTKPVSALIAELGNLSKNSSDGVFSKIVCLFSEAASPAFKCRNSIFHGVSVVYNSGSIDFITNTKWMDEDRKRESRSFIADSHTLTLLNEVFYTLLSSIKVIEKIALKKLSITDVNVDSLTCSLSESRSVANELEDLAAAFNNEKY